MNQNIFKIEEKNEAPSLKKVARFKKNPFMESLMVKTKSKRLTVAAGSKLIGRNGEQSLTTIAQFISVDESQFVKVFLKDLAIWFDLSRPAIKTLGVIMWAMKESIGKDIISLDFHDVEEGGFKMSKYTFFRGISELIDNGVIARHIRPSLYFINPAIIFNGDRVRFVREYRKVDFSKNQLDLFPAEEKKIEGA